MRAIPESEFLDWCRARGIAVKPSHAQTWPRDLGILDGSATHASIDSFQDLGWIESMLRSLFAELAAPAPWYLWPRVSNFADALLGEEKPLLSQVVRSLGDSIQTNGAIEFLAEDRDALYALLAILLHYQWSWHMDAFLIPSDASFVLWLDHDGMLWGTYRDQQRMNRFVAQVNAIESVD